MDYHFYISPITKTASYIGHGFTWKWVQWNSGYPARGNGGPASVQPAPNHSPCEHTWQELTCSLLGHPTRTGVSITPLPGSTEKPKSQCQFSFSSPQFKTKNILEPRLDFPSDLCYFQSYWCEMLKPFWNESIWTLPGIINGFLSPTVLSDGEFCSPAWLLLMSMAHSDGIALRKSSQEYI